MTDSDKAQTNKKWTSSEEYRKNYNNIFKKEEKEDEAGNDEGCVSSTD